MPPRSFAHLKVYFGESFEWDRRDIRMCAWFPLADYFIQMSLRLIRMNFTLYCSLHGDFLCHSNATVPTFEWISDFFLWFLLFIRMTLVTFECLWFHPNDLRLYELPWPFELLLLIRIRLSSFECIPNGLHIWMFWRNHSNVLFVYLHPDCAILIRICFGWPSHSNDCKVHSNALSWLFLLPFFLGSFIFIWLYSITPQMNYFFDH